MGRSLLTFWLISMEVLCSSLAVVFFMRLIQSNILALFISLKSFQTIETLFTRIMKPDNNSRVNLTPHSYSMYGNYVPAPLPLARLHWIISPCWRRKEKSYSLIFYQTIILFQLFLPQDITTEAHFNSKYMRYSVCCNTYGMGGYFIICTYYGY